jgi:rhamnose utilization protein RhaD (predicted bifunctional aldolase and dehydrogenase)
VTLPLDAAQAMAEGAPAPEGALRPSIETSLHAIVPAKIVAHLHMVDAIAYGVRDDAEAALTEALGGLGWAWVPYAKPGAGLAKAVVKAVAGRNVEVVILGNHGILLCGESCEAVDRLIGEVRRRLAAPIRQTAADADRLAEIGERLGLEPARFAEAHLAATDPTNLRFATAGSLYPDHPVFLGRGARVQAHEAPLDATAETALHLVPGVGALLTRDLSDSAHQMAACLGLVTSRIAEQTEIHTLTREQEDELINWDAEIYRRGLART